MHLKQIPTTQGLHSYAQLPALMETIILRLHPPFHATLLFFS